MRRCHAHAVLAVALGLLAACSSASTGGGEPPAPALWTFEEFAWYRWINKVSMNSTVGPIVAGKTVLYGGTYGYTVAGQETKTSRLALLDAATGVPRWRMEYGAGFGSIVLQGGSIAVAAGDGVLDLDFATGAQRWQAQIRPRTLTAVGTVLLVAERETIHAIDPASGAQRWQARSKIGRAHV